MSSLVSLDQYRFAGAALFDQAHHHSDCFLLDGQDGFQGVLCLFQVGLLGVTRFTEGSQFGLDVAARFDGALQGVQFSIAAALATLTTTAASTSETTKATKTTSTRTSVTLFFLDGFDQGLNGFEFRVGETELFLITFHHTSTELSRVEIAATATRATLSASALTTTTLSRCIIRCERDRHEGDDECERFNEFDHTRTSRRDGVVSGYMDFFECRVS